jgi:hypothetical protein
VILGERINVGFEEIQKNPLATAGWLAVFILLAAPNQRVCIELFPANNSGSIQPLDEGRIRIVVRLPG